MCLMAVSLHKKLLENNQNLLVEYISSEDNCYADWLSCYPLTYWNFSLQPQVLDDCLTQLGMWGLSPPVFDLFASEETHICPSFASLLPAEHQTAWDAFLMTTWPTRSWLFPPTPLLPRVVARMKQELENDSSKISYLVTSLWKSQPCYPLLA